MVCEISQLKKGPCENGPWLRNNFTAPKPHYENRLPLQNGFIAFYPHLQKFSQLRSDPLAHECHFAAPYIHFAAAKWLRNLHALKSSTSKSRRHFEGCFAAAKPPFGTQVPLRSVVRLFRSCEMGCENDAEIPLAAKTPSRYEIHASSLQKVPSAAKRNSDPWCPF